MLLLFHSPGKQEASVWLALLRPSNAIPLVMAAPIVRRISLCAWMINGPGLSICLRDGENQRGLLSSGTRWGTPGAWHRTLPTAWPGPQPALAAAGGGGLAPCEWGRSPLPQQGPRCTPRARHWMYITAASRSVQFLKCCIILLCLTKPNAGGGAGQQGSARTARRDSSTFATTHSSDTFPRAKFYFSIPFAESQP